MYAVATLVSKPVAVVIRLAAFNPPFSIFTPVSPSTFNPLTVGCLSVLLHFKYPLP